MKAATFTIRGTAPLLMHSERLANPFDPLTKQIKALTGKRKKTEDELREISRLEWLGGIYHDDHNGVHLPGYNVLRALVQGAKLRKLGRDVERGAMVQEDAVVIQHDGPSNLDALFADPRFVDVRSVKVGTSKVLRCRPMFRSWACSFTALFDEDVLQADDLGRIVRDTGAMIGIGDYRPRFGRFEVVQ